MASMPLPSYHLSEKWLSFWRAPTLAAIYWLGATFVTMSYVVILQWTPSFLVRSYGMSTGMIGTWLAPILGIGGGAGTIIGGFLADRLGSHDRRWYMLLPGYAMAISIPFAAAVY